jgi:hypothetical protein
MMRNAMAKASSILRCVLGSCCGFWKSVKRLYLEVESAAMYSSGPTC